MRKCRLIAIALCLPGSIATAAETGSSCRTSPNLVGACFAVHGRLYMANGTPSVRILPLGTTGILGVLDRQSRAESEEVAPKEVKDLLAPDPFFIDVYGDYVICPFEKDQSGSMRSVCIESASHLTARRR